MKFGLVSYHDPVLHETVLNNLWDLLETQQLDSCPAKFRGKSLRRSWSLLELLGSLSSQQRLKGWTSHVRYGVRLVKKGLALGLWSLHTWISGWCRETQPSISAIYHMCIMFLIDSMFGYIYIDLTVRTTSQSITTVRFILMQSSGLAYFPIMSLE